MTNDEKLIRDIKRKRRNALEKVIDQYTPYVAAVVYNILYASMTHEDIEEIVSDVFLTLWRNAEKFDIEKGCLRTYLGTIARNLAKNRLTKLCESTELDENIAAPDCDAGTTIIENEQRSILVSAINELGEPDCEIFMRYYFYDETITSMARLLGLPVGTIKSKLARGRKKLREILERSGFNG